MLVCANGAAFVGHSLPRGVGAGGDTVGVLYGRTFVIHCRYIVGCDALFFSVVHSLYIIIL